MGRSYFVEELDSLSNCIPYLVWWFASLQQTKPLSLFWHVDHVQGTIFDDLFCMLWSPLQSLRIWSSLIWLSLPTPNWILLLSIVLISSPIWCTTFSSTRMISSVLTYPMPVSPIESFCESLVEVIHQVNPTFVPSYLKKSYAKYNLKYMSEKDIHIPLRTLPRQMCISLSPLLTH